MWSIDATGIKGQTVRPAPFGIEGDEQPKLVWEDPNPNAMIRFCQVDIDSKPITAKTLMGLQMAAEKAGLVYSDDAYLP